MAAASVVLPTPLAHHHDQTVPIGSDFIDQGGQVRCIDLVGQLDGIGAIRGVGIDQQMAQSVEAHEVERLERDLIPRQRLEDRRNGGQRSLLFS